MHSDRQIQNLQSLLLDDPHYSLYPKDYHHAYFTLIWVRREKKATTIEAMALKRTTPAEISLICLASSEISFECISTNSSTIVFISSEIITKKIVKTRIDNSTFVNFK